MGASERVQVKLNGEPEMHRVPSFDFLEKNCCNFELFSSRVAKNRKINFNELPKTKMCFKNLGPVGPKTTRVSQESRLASHIRLLS